MDDYISRQAALDIVKRTSGDYATAFCEISRLPAANVRPVVLGEWVKSPLSGVCCSQCGTEGSPQWIACPVCGADMRGSHVK